MNVSEESEWREMREEYMGFCTECKDWTRDCTEPDAEHYDCPDCEAYTVHGAETALMMGFLEIDSHE
jgi:hypothetical protein